MSQSTLRFSLNRSVRLTFVFLVFLFLLAIALPTRSVFAITDGGLDTTFLPEVKGLSNGIINTSAIQPDGKIIIGGSFYTVNGVDRRYYIARLNVNGSLDTSFSPLFNGVINAVFIQKDEKILVSGSFNQVNGFSRSYLVRINSDGSLDDTFNVTLSYSSSGVSIVEQPDGKILIAGEFVTVNGASARYIARLNENGSLDASFNTGSGPSSLLKGAIFDSINEKIVIYGNFTQYNNTPRTYVARLNLDGSLDPSFAPGLDAYVETLLVQPDGKLIIGGQFSTVNITSRPNIARFNADGNLDSTFDPGTGMRLTYGPGIVSSLALQPDGKILVGGLFSKINGVNTPCMARLNANGSLDNSFSIGTGLNDCYYEQRYLFFNTGKILLTGPFTTINGISRPYIARLNNTLPGYSSNPDLNSTINVGTAPIGGSVSSTMQISEIGSAMLNVTGYSLSGAHAGDFSLQPASLSIADGGSVQNVGVICTPHAMGSRTATLTINHNGVGGPASYTLICTGTEARVYLPVVIR
ncbi:hypothetical protein [Candidatus Oscillochloris fontis]|uniref:hypothetical protein n=1 Tax=Candidatus Oscillochloris fontis TaxID=2496868 RepID=UPI00101CCCC5|nr:hypothetical protein [Candidatus Oscillochloris fontis]